MTWFDECYRKLFFDFHTHSAAENVAARFDAESWAESLESVGAQAVSSFAKCGHGWKYYRKGRAGFPHPKLPDGLDMLEETVAACHRRGIRVIAYYHTFNSEPVARLHPDWIEEDASGHKKGHSICHHSPVVEEEWLPQAEEIARHYAIDGIFFDGTYAASVCHCPACRAAFRAACGLDIPAGPADPAWGDYVDWQLTYYRRLRERVCEAVHRGNPEALVAINWCYSHRQPEDPPDGIGFLSLDICPENQVANGSLQARHWARLGKSFDIMNSAFLKWWGEWGIKPVAALRQECATVLANGGKTWIGYQMYPDFTVEPALMDAFKETFDFVREREPLLKDSVPEPYLAVLQSIASYRTHTPGLLAEHTALLGAHRMLTARGLPYHAVSESVLEKTLSDYRAVLLFDQRFLSETLCRALKGYVASGGSLIATGLTATHDAAGRPTGGCALAELLGIAWEGVSPHTHAYLELEDGRLRPGAMRMPLLVESAIGLARPTTARSLAALRAPALRSDGQPLLRYSPPGLPTGYPAVTVNGCGAGQAVYIAADIAAAYWTGNQWNLAHLLENLLHRLLIAAPVVRLEAPDVVEVALARQGRRRLIHLINHAGERPAMGLSHTVGYAMTEDILPLHHIGVTLHAPEDPAALTWEPEATPLSWERRGDFIRAVIDRLDLHGCLCLEPAG